ncbi:unnamed protein product [Mytilus edulis]|uniref:Uncharacterized protein n=1 Tax=Mytilus edulis TaxID=6550 RepID=A0A8S3UG37_MYTED|nr:unnamed protein product [Mytilus edulis]
MSLKMKFLARFLSKIIIMSSGKHLLADWEVFCPIGPSLAFHVGACIGRFLYVHGGRVDRNSIEASNKLHCLNFDTMIWNEVRVPGSPALSHHACVTIDDRYLLLIGECKWLYPSSEGFPSDAGLSSHTATLLNNGKVLVLGREGPLRMQPDDKKHAATESRSGHTTNFIGPRLYVLGGRNDELLEVHSGYRSGSPDNEKAAESFKRIIRRLKPMDKMPGGRRHHIALESSGAILIHGGETFDGRSKIGKPVGDMFIMTDKPSINFYKIGESKIGRSGHICCVTKDENILIHGGFGHKIIHGDTRWLDFRTRSRVQNVIELSPLSKALQRRIECKQVEKLKDQILSCNM